MSFLIVLFVVWFGAVAVWYLASGALRTADVDRIRDRLAGTSKEKKKKAEAAQAAPKSLIETEDGATGRMAVRILQKYEVHHKLQQLLEQAGLKWHVARLVHACMGCFLAGYLVAWLVADLRAFGLIAGGIAATFPFIYVAKARGIRMHKFEEQFPESLEFVARSMRAGHAFSVSLEMLHREFQEPLAGEFRRTFEEHNLGLPLDTALQKLAKRVPLLDVHFFVSAVLLQKRTGGNLAEILDKLAHVIRERFKLRGRIKAISAHGKMTGTSLTLIPIGVGVVMFYVNPYYANFFFNDEVGHYLIGGAVLLQVIGYGVIQKIVTIEV